MATLKEHILVEGNNWGVVPVLTIDKTEDAFVKRHMADKMTYKDLDEAKKIASLKLVWKLCQENKPEGFVENPKAIPQVG